MQNENEISYRGYVIRQAGACFEATPGADEGVEITIVGNTVGDMLSYVDTLWDAIDNPAKAPSWIQMWLSGELTRIYPAQFMQVARKRWRGFTTGVVTAAAALMITGAATATAPIKSYLDWDQDGRIDRDDLKIALHKVRNGEAPATRIVRLNGHVYEVSIAPSSNQAIDWEIVALKDLPLVGR